MQLKGDSKVKEGDISVLQETKGRVFMVTRKQLLGIAKRGPLTTIQQDVHEKGDNNYVAYTH